MRFAPVSVAAIVAALASSTGGPAGGVAWAAPPTKRCIEAAESGQQLRSAGKLVEARKAFGVCTAPACPAAVRRDCARWIEEVDTAQPTVSVRLEDEKGNEVTEGKVVLDGHETMKPAAGRAVPVDPGAHRFVWMRSEGHIEEELVIREGERNRTIILRAPRAATSGTSGPPTPDRTGDRSSSSSPVPWILAGVGILALGGGTAFWVTGLGQRSDLERTCAAAHTCAMDDIDASRTKLIIGDVLAGVGIVALAGAAFLFLTRADDPPTRQAGSSPSR